MLVKPRIKPGHNVIQVTESTICIGEIPSSAFQIHDARPEYLALIDLLDGTRTVPRIVKEYRTRYPEATGEEIREAIDELEARRLLDDGAAESADLSSRELELYDRQLLLYSLLDRHGKNGFRYQETLKSKRVCIFGMGGWGTWISLHLALNGIGELRLVDGDVVELSNLNRQVLYDHSDVGAPKVEAARKAIARINPHVKVDPRCTFVPKNATRIAELLAGADALVLCWANLAYFLPDTAEELVHRAAHELRIPVFEAAADPFDVSVGPVFLNNGATPCFQCIRAEVSKSVLGENPADVLLHRARLERRFRNGVRRVDAWQTSPSLSVMAGLVGDQAVKLLTGLETSPALADRKFSVSLSTFEAKTARYAKRPDCAWCGERKDPQ
jgi:bacteriocin biosynthesis cyclodehydratase domain-containing protein